MAAFRQGGGIFDARQRQALDAPQVEGVYVANSGVFRYQEYLELYLGTLLKSGTLSLRRRVEILSETAAGLISLIFTKPPESPLIDRAGRVAGQIVSLLMADPNAIGEFLDLAAGDYSTPAHSTTVCFLSVTLAQRAGVKERRALEDLALGALLHDIGQTRINRRILRKRGPLTTAEYDLIKKTPWWGVDILAQSGSVRKDAFIPVLQHQERMDGSGYPVGLRGNDIHLYGRICGIVEAYDAITSKHVYRDALDSFPALVTMMGEAEKYDGELLQSFIKLLKRQPEPQEAKAATQSP
ncbi:MAG: HD domain-containing protein [candidate division Zixibacteria bacterium]|nr:HD domain-containing protein [candidate division Zixibacteria bacterium]